MNHLTLNQNAKAEQQNPNLSMELYDFRFSRINSLIVKVTNRCNLNCAYCYENVSRKGTDMTFGVFKTIIDKTLNSTNDRKINIIFHGGEPTLLKNEWYVDAVSYAVTKAVELGKEMKFGIQTNLTTLNQNKIDLFRYLNISPGVSIDDPTLSSSSYRQKENLVVKNIELLIKSEIKFGVLSTINSSNFNIFKEIMLWLKEYDIKHFKANVVYPVGHGFNQKSLTAEEIFYAQKSMLDYMIETKGKCVIEDNVVFKNLGFAVIDEQHKFGVAQRAQLWKKNTIPPHVLVMTATPIPRTLALTAYGDLDYSVIDELPPGRQPVQHYIVPKVQGHR